MHELLRYMMHRYAWIDNFDTWLMTRILWYRRWRMHHDGLRIKEMEERLREAKP